MRHIMKTGLLFLLAAALLLSVSLAEVDVLSEREKAVRLADRALEEKYGITQLTQEYFGRETAEKTGGIYIVKYTGEPYLGYVLGDYRVVVENGQVTEISWTHDGEDTSGGLAAEAWGQEQLMEMLRLNQETGDTTLFAGKAEAIGKRHGYVIDNDLTGDSDSKTVAEGRETKYGWEIWATTNRDFEDIFEIAKQGIIAAYELSDEQAAQLEILNEIEDAEWDCYYFHKLPCYRVIVGLDDGEEKDVLPNGLVYTEKEGVYYVYVNLLTGLVEEIFTNAGIGGNG